MFNYEVTSLSKHWLWILIVILIVICCIILTLVLYKRSENQKQIAYVIP